MAAKISKANLGKLNVVSTAQANAGGDPSKFHSATAKDMEGLTKLGLVETNPQMVGPDGKSPWRLTEAGEKALNEGNENVTDNNTTTQTAAADTPTFEIDDNIPVPAAATASRGRTSKYPFDKLEVGQSFHIPATDDKPEPHKTMHSTISSAREKFNRNFVVSPVGEDDPRGKGARVFRLEGEAPPKRARKPKGDAAQGSTDGQPSGQAPQGSTDGGQAQQPAA